MKIGILATGITPDELLSQYGSYADMFVQLFDLADERFEYEVYDVRDDEFPLDIQQCDAWVITGSKFNVYQNLPWMQRLKSLIIEIHAAKQPMVGICFGHQIIADAFGGQVDKYPEGWGVGLHTYQITQSGEDLVPGAADFTISAMHQDQVLVKPDNAEVLATSDFCQYAGLVYDDRILTLQAHPEFNLAYETDLVDLRKGEVIPIDTAEAGLEGLRKSDAQTDSVMVAQWMAKFLRDRAV